MLIYINRFAKLRMSVLNYPRPDHAGVLQFIMSGQCAWIIEIECALGRIQESHRAVEASLFCVQADYRFIAETIKAALRADPELNQKQIAQAIGKSSTWVSRTLT